MFCRFSVFYSAIIKGGLLLIFFTITLHMVSCRYEKNKSTENSDSFDQIISKANSLYLQSEEKMILVDSAYRAITDPTIEDMCKRYHFKSNYLNQIGEHNQSILYADSLISIIQNNGMEVQLAEFYGKAHFIIGDVLMKRKDYNNAFRYYYEGKRNIELTHDTCLFSSFSGNLGTVSYRQENYLDAARFFKQAFNELSHCTAKHALMKYQYQQANLDNIALSYDKHGMVDSAIHYYQGALDYISRHEHGFPQEKVFTEISRGIIYGNLATAYVKTGKLKDAEVLFKKSIAINTKKGYVNGDAQLTQLKLADLYIQTSRLKNAYPLLEEVRSVLDTLPTADLKLRWYKVQTNYYAHAQDLRAANSYLSAYVALKDSMDQDNKKLVRVNFNKEFESIEHESVLATLRRNDQLKTFYLVIAIAIGVLAIVVTGLIWQNRRRLALLNIKISEQNSHMQKALVALEQSQEENTRMMKIVAHDLRNPIGGITTIATMMLEEQERSADDHDMLELIKTSGQNSLELVNDLLNAHTRVEDFKKENVDLYQLLHYCVDILHFKAKEKGQRLTLKAEHITLSLNREKMWRVISNLIANAIKFSPGKTVISIRMEQQPGSMRIAVEDHGIGIPIEIKDKVFDMFSEAKRQGTAGEQPFGLGLAISKQIVEAHGGKIWFESNPGDGTIFYLELPMLPILI